MAPESEDVPGGGRARDANGAEEKTEFSKSMMKQEPEEKPRG